VSCKVRGGLDMAFEVALLELVGLVFVLSGNCVGCLCASIVEVVDFWRALSW